MVYLSLIACYKFQFNCMSFKSLLHAWYWESFIFWSSIRGPIVDRLVIKKCSCKVALMEPVLMPTVSAVSCTLTQRFCSTAFTTVFFADSFRRTSWPGLIFNASSASTKLSCPTPDHGIWWHIFTINNNHSVVYLLWLNVLQCQKFCNCIITDFSEISHNVQPAFFQYIKSHKVKKQMTWNF